jgi:hypothetical protein
MAFASLLEGCSCFIRNDDGYECTQVFGPESSNGEIYQRMAADLVDNVPDGICNTLFAYGVTSSGKTHTMHGTDSQVCAPALGALTFRAGHRESAQGLL